MKIRWIAATAGLLLCSGTGLYAQTANNGNGPPTSSIWDGTYSMQQAGRGQDTYGVVCYGCHGHELEGNDAEGVTPLVGDHFMTNWDTHTLGDLVKRVHAQPNDEPGDIDMPTRVDLVAFILWYNKVPAGKADMSMDYKVLYKVGITYGKPPEK